MTDDLLTALSRRVVIADGATGTMLQAHDLSLDDFEGHEGCNEVLNVTRPDVVRSLHEAFFDVGVDAVETNTFGANLANLAEYGIQSRIRELAQAGAQIAADTARDYSTKDHPRYVLGSVGPGTKLPTLGHAPFADLRDAYTEQVIPRFARNPATFRRCSSGTRPKASGNKLACDEVCVVPTPSR